MPESVLESLTQGASVGPEIGLVNLSPYDGWLERVGMRWEHSHPAQPIKTLSLSGDLDLVKFSEKQCAFTILEEHILSNKGLMI